MFRRQHLTRVVLALLALTQIACAGHAPRIYDFEDMEVFPHEFDTVWSVVDTLSRSKKWRIEASEKASRRAYLTTDWMPDTDDGGDYGSVGISLGQANKPHNEKTREVAISIRVVSESATATRVKITCLFRIQTSQGHSGTGQTMFGTSRGVVEQRLLSTIRSRLAAS